MKHAVVWWVDVVLSANVPSISTLRFLSMLEEEVYSQSSPIWDPDFMASSTRSAQLGIQTGNCSLLYLLTRFYYKILHFGHVQGSGLHCNAMQLPCGRDRRIVLFNV